MTSIHPFHQPLFQPTDILEPIPLPTPPQSTDADSKDGDDVIMDHESARPMLIRMESPPPDYEEEPSDLEDGYMASMPRAEQKQEQSFVSSGLLDFDGPRQHEPDPAASVSGRVSPTRSL